MTMLRPEILTAEAFAPFGDVIEARPDSAVEINAGYTTRFHALAQVQTDDAAIISIFRGRPRALEAAMLECHPLGSQAFVPLGGQAWLAVVAETPDASALRAFYCRGDQGVNYRAGVWHHPLLVLGAAQDFLIVDRAGRGPNLQEVFFDPVAIAAAP
ncbi:ureidoglycolate lyase [Abyssibius alkaniclasticus]|uniref:ureidoglycolate lyase n=2 Tax=Abyssibius alkaniclasticus TaxID=2881234 RepID=UPI003B66B40D